MKKSASLFQRTSINFMVKAGAQLFNLALIPIYMRYLPLDGYGALNIGYVFINFFVLIGTLGQNESLTRFYTRLQTDKNPHAVFGATFLLVSLSSMILALLLGVLATPAAGLLFDDTKLVGLFRLILLVGIVEAWNLLFIVLLQIEKNSRLYAIALLCKHGLKLVLSWLFLAHFHLGIQGAILALLIGGVVLLLIVLPFARTHFSFNFQRGLFGTILRYGLPFIFTGFAMYLLFQIDQVMLKFLIGLEAVAVYGMSYKLGSAVQYINTSFSLAWFPHIFVQKDSEARATIIRVSSLYFTLITMIGLFLTILTRFYLPLVLPGPYILATQIIPWVLWGYIIYGLTDFISAGLLLRLKSGVFSMVSGGAAVLNIVLNYLFIPRFGIVAAAVVTFFSFVFLFISTLIVSHRFFPISFPVKNYRKPFFLTTALLLLTYLPENIISYPLVYGLILSALSLTLPFAIKMISLKQLRDLLS